jgi:hypothetical protein
MSEAKAEAKAAPQPWRPRRQAKEEAPAEAKAETESSLLAKVATYFKDQAFGAGKNEGFEVIYEDFISANKEMFAGVDSEGEECHKIE